LLGWLAHTE